MFFKTEKSSTPQSIAMCINNEEELESCIRHLEPTNTITRCALHFTCDKLPEEKIYALKEALIKQSNLDSLSLTAAISKESSKKIASILGDAFKHLTHLKSLMFRGLFEDNTTTSLCQLIQTTTNLYTLSVGAYQSWRSSEAMNKEGALAIAEALLSNKTLTHLNLQDNTLDPAGIEAIINSLNTNTSLKEVQLSNNIRCKNKGILEALINSRLLENIQIDEWSVGTSHFTCFLNSDDQFKKVLNHLSKSNTIQRLSLSVYDFEPAKEDLAALASMIKNLPIRKLKLSGFCFEFKSFFEDAFIEHHALTHLGFDGNSKITDETIKALTQFITSSKQLTSLSFGSWRLESSSSPFVMSNLGQALEDNKTLTHLDLSCNKLKDLTLIARIIRNNTCLKTINLSGNNFSNDREAVYLLLKAIGTNITLESLNLNSNTIEFPDNANLMLEKNKSLTSFEILKFFRDDMDPGKSDDYRLENRISDETYLAIQLLLERNFAQKNYQNYQLLCQIGQANHLPKELITLIATASLAKLGSYEIKRIAKAIKKGCLTITQDSSENEQILQLAQAAESTIAADDDGCRVGCLLF